MTLLHSLKLAACKRPSAQSPVIFRRNKLSTKLWEQIQIAQSADFADAEYANKGWVGFNREFPNFFLNMRINTVLRVARALLSC